MNPGRVLFFILMFCCGCFCSLPLYAQKANKDSVAAAQKMEAAKKKEQEKAKAEAAKQLKQQQAAKQKAQQTSRDSAAKAREKQTMERQTAQKRRMDSLQLVRKKTTDSIFKIRKRKTDSLAAIRKYKESRKYKDSVEKARIAKAKSLQAVRMAKLDSAKNARKKITDSAIAARKIVTDSTKAIQKKRSDSLAAKRKYRESKRFSDSVAVVKKMRMDSITAKRKSFSDSLTAKRKKVTDSLAAQRKAKTDNLTAIRKKKADSLTAIKKVRTDSLAKVKEKKEKIQKDKQKDKEQKQQLAFELKIKKKQKAYTNEKMLKRRWSVPRRIVQNTFTHYNYYFNADKKMDEAIANMLRAKKDNYDSLLALFPFNPDKDSAMLSSDMDSIIYKSSMGIQIHDPRTKWGDDLYLLLGQAYFYKGNYKEASASFRYVLSLRDKKKKPNQSNSVYNKKTGKQLSIAQEDKDGFLAFLKHRSVHNESLLWLSRTYTQMKQEGNAESVLDLLETDPNFPEDMQGRLALEKAFINLSQNDYKAAAEQLTIVAADNNLPDWVRMRSAYIAGQIQQSRGEYVASAASFQKVVDLNPKIDMDFYARKNMAYSLMYAGGNQDEAVTSLKKVLKDGKYVPYYEQVYFVMGRLSANSGKYDEAIAYLNDGIRSPKSTPKQKGLSFATLGNVYYKIGRYEDAKMAYDSATVFAGVLPNDTMMLTAVKRSAALGSITTPLAQIKHLDSLIALAMLPEKEIRAEVRRYIRMLQERRADSIFKSEQITTTGGGTGTTNTNSGNPYANWYFANGALMQQGVNEFKRKWGNRTLADNWRRSAAAGFGNNNAQASANAGNEESNVELDENGIPTEEALMVFIPRTAESIEEAKGAIRQAYMNAANAYIKDLEDYPPAIKVLDTLDKRFPNHEFKAESVYLRYLAYMRMGKVQEATTYADELLQKYPDSKWAALVKPSESTGTPSAEQEDVTAYYEKTYAMILDRQYAWALDRVLQSKKLYTNPRYSKRFTIIEGIALAGMNKYGEADTLIRGFISSYPSDSLRPWADAILKYIEEKKPAAPVTGSVPATPPSGQAAGQVTPPAGSLALPTTPPPPLPGAMAGDVPPATVPASYVYRQDAEHYVLFVYGAMESRAAGVKAAINDFNTFKFSSLSLSTDMQQIKSDVGIVAVRSFKNLAAAKIYVNALRGTGQIFREYKNTEYQLVFVSAANYPKLMADKDMKAYMQFYNANYK